MDELVHDLIERNNLRSPEIVSAFQKIGRKHFVTEEMADEAYANSPLPIGHGQTISQPLTVAFMLELLQPKRGQKILDVGSGSGWTTSLLAEIAGETGHIFAIERVSELKEFGQKNVEKFHFYNIDFFCMDGSKGLPDHAPFDRILVSAAAQEVPEALKRQLAKGGRMVIPTVADDLRVIVRRLDGTFAEHEYPGFVFVPLLED
jgi:protein-L-isoaspartate(D-aspartate) O-methyltransferase